MRVVMRVLGLLLLAPLFSACAHAQDVAMLAPERIARLPDPQRSAWRAYLETSATLAVQDRRSMDDELSTLGRSRWTPARSVRPFELDDARDDEWFGSEDARRIAENMLSFQTPAGGWSKRIDFTSPRQPGESYSVSTGWRDIGTFDNNATTEQIRFLARVHGATGDARFRRGVLTGIEYVLRAQYPNGCWPQVYPLQGSYHDAVTYNDDAMVHALELLRDVVRGRLSDVPAGLRERARSGIARGVDCIVATQVVVDGERTVWCAQHDPLTFEPVQGRAYEHASLSGGESGRILQFLMQVDSPDARVVSAVHAAAAWFERTAIHGFEYDMRTGLIARESATPLWARFYEIRTNRPIFSNRDGRIMYDWRDLEPERRDGYAWYRDTPARVLRLYANWASRHPPAST